MIKLAYDCSTRRSELPDAQVVVLVEHRDDVFDRLKYCFTTAGFSVTRARESTEAIKLYVSKPANLIVVNADMPAGSAWLLAAKLQLTHPAARIWAYVFQPSTFDVAAANLLAIEELIEYGGKVAELESQLLDRLGMPAKCFESTFTFGGKTMSKRSRSTTLAIALIVVFSVWAMTSTDASAQGMHQHGADSAHQHQGHSTAGAMAAVAARPAPHGGQFSVAGPLRFEAVYLPQETRVYLYDASNRPISASGAAGQIAMTVRGYEKVYRYPLAHVATQAGSRIQDYLAVAVNVSRIKDGDMTVAFELTNLPSRDLPGARFTQTFVLSKIPVTLAALTEADRAGIAQQKVCSVMGGKLGGMGTPVKVLLGDQPIYLCCKGCLEKVQKNPAAYLPKSTPAQPVSNKIAVSASTSADQAAIARQRVCAVAGSRLGGMGTPVKVAMNGQSLFLCCKGCVGKVEKDPAGYFAKAAQLRAGR